jgi:Mn2+/Fe2+ NRAMP family transporter
VEAADTVKQPPALKRPNLWRSLLLFFSIVGPGFITGNLDNDAAGIGTYSQAGAQFGYGLLWTLIPITIGLIVVQEICVRMGVVTGKGLADLIREKFGVRITLLVLALLVMTNLLTTMAEFAGVAASADLFHPFLRYVAVPAAALFVAVLALRADYKTVEKVFLAACLVYFTYIISGFLAKPDWHEVLLATVVPHFTPTAAYWLSLLAVIGTTITPWMQFYIQSSVVEKGVKPKDLRYSQIDVVTGCLVTDIVSFFIIVSCGATLFVHGQTNITEATQAAKALAPLAGPFAEILFAIGLLNASLFAASVLPLSTAYTVCEALGFEAGVAKTFREAPAFYTLYFAIVAIGAVSVLVLQVPLFSIIEYSQAIAGMLLPFIVVAMLLLVNDKQLMGKYVNGPVANVIAWATAGVTIAATVVVLAAPLLHWS